jgi:hypothetical protein
MKYDFNMVRLSAIDELIESGVLTENDIREAVNAVYNSMMDAMIYGTGIVEMLIECNHEWQHYEGISEKYDFCKKCDVKNIL